MQYGAKISLVRSVLDELATIEHLTTTSQKRETLGLIQAIVKDIPLPNHPTKTDITVYSINLLAHVKTTEVNRQLAGLATLAEKALTELHLNFFNWN